MDQLGGMGMMVFFSGFLFGVTFLGAFVMFLIQKRNDQDRWREAAMDQEIRSLRMENLILKNTLDERGRHDD